MNCLRTTSIVLAATLFLATAAAAAEIQLRRDCRARGGLVTLGDVADVRTNDAEVADQLAAIELCPAPAPGKKRPLGVAEIRQTLVRRGVNLAQCRFSGASQVVITSTDESGAAARAADQLDQSRARVEQTLRSAIVAFLRERGVRADDLEMTLTLPPDAAWNTLATIGAWRISGGAEPWTGQQDLVATGANAAGPQSVAFRAEIAEPDMIVVAAVPVARGAILRETDLTLEPRASLEAGEKYFHSVADLVGHEATQPLAQGRAVTARTVRRPLLVKRGELVTVLARSGGIVVETTGRARDDGSVGDVVAIESIANKQSYFARVSGISQVEVYAKATRPAPPQTAVPLPRPQPVVPAAPSSHPGTPPAAMANDPISLPTTPARADGGQVQASPAPQLEVPVSTPPMQPAASPASDAPAEDSGLRWVKRRAR